MNDTSGARTVSRLSRKPVPKNTNPSDRERMKLRSMEPVYALDLTMFPESWWRCHQLPLIQLMAHAIIGELFKLLQCQECL